MKKISIPDIFRFVSIIMLFCLGWLALETHIDKGLIKWTREWIEPLDHIFAIVALYTIITICSIAYFYNHIVKKAHLSRNGWIVWILLTAVYSYYRFNADAPFEFWAYNDWVWLDAIYVIDGIFVGYELSYLIRMWLQEKSSQEKKEILMTDEALHPGDTDMFGYGDVARDLRVQLESVDVSTHAFSVGITGEWGIGKSSFLNLFAKQIEEDGQIVIRFAPRSAKNIELIQDRFFVEYSKGLSKYTFKAKASIGKYAYVLNLHSSTKWIYSIWKLFDDWTYESEKDNINSIIRSIGKRIYVVIEDLDRLTAEEILETLKLIDSNGNFCNTIFLTAYDRKYVNVVLRAKLGYDESETYFTDKYFQYEMQLFKQETTPLYDFMTTNLYNWAIAEWGDDPYVCKYSEDDWYVLFAMIKKYITNIRQAKRYINLFRTIYLKSREKVDFADFVIVTLIRFIDMKTYYDLYENVYVTKSSEASPNNTTYKLVDNYKELAEKSRIPQLEELLEYLFSPPIVRLSDPQYNRIYKVEYFENYFYHTLKGRLYYQDLNRMMEAKSLKEAISIIKLILDKENPEREKQSIVEFLSTREPIWIQTQERLERYMCILLYARDIIPEIYLPATVNKMLGTQEARDMEEWMTKEQYKESILRAIDIMRDYVPHLIGVTMLDRLKERLPDFIRAEQEQYIETIQEAQSILYKSQVKYDSLHGKISDWRADWSLDFAEPINDEDEADRKRKADQLKVMLYSYPDEYAGAMLKFGESDSKSKYTTIVLNHRYAIIKALGGVEVLQEWENAIKNENLRFIIDTLLELETNNKQSSANLNVHIETPRENYEEVAKALKKAKSWLRLRNRKKV